MIREGLLTQGVEVLQSDVRAMAEVLEVLGGSPLLSGGPLHELPTSATRWPRREAWWRRPRARLWQRAHGAKQRAEDCGEARVPLKAHRVRVVARIARRPLWHVGRCAGARRLRRRRLRRAPATKGTYDTTRTVAALNDLRRDETLLDLGHLATAEMVPGEGGRVRTEGYGEGELREGRLMVFAVVGLE